MSLFKEIPTNVLKGNPFQMIGKQWMLITAEKNGIVNTMTASWGGLGVMWGRDVTFVVIRPQRYTKEFIDVADNFSLCFFDDTQRKTLAYLGSVSGRDEDKIKKSGLMVAHENGIPYFEEAKTILFCNKLFAQPFNENSFIKTDIINTMYQEKDFHTLYISEITKILTL